MTRHVDVAPVTVHDAAHGRKADAAALGFRRIEQLEYVRQNRVRNAAVAVLDTDSDEFTADRNGAGAYNEILHLHLVRENFDDASMLAERIARVDQKILNHLLHLCPIAFDGWQRT